MSCRCASQGEAANKHLRNLVTETEVRAYWREKGWASGMVEAMREDVRTASAILSAPGYLSGLDAERMATMRRLAVDAHAREAQAALDEALAARRKVETASGRMIELVAPRLRE